MPANTRRPAGDPPARPLPYRALRAVNRSVKWVTWQEFKRRYDADVDGVTYLDELGVDHPERFFYFGSNWLPTRLALGRLRLGADDVVVDLGAGKGLAVLLAAAFPVRGVIGVELSEELVEAANGNLRRNGGRIRAGRVEMITADALAWDLPDDVTVVYLFCPFIGELFHQTMERLLEAHDRRPRPLRIVYNYPWEHNWLVSTGRVRVLDVAPGVWPMRPRWWRRCNVIVTYGVGDRDFPAPRGVPPSAEALAYWSRPNKIRFKLARPGHELMESTPPGTVPPRG